MGKWQNKFELSKWDIIEKVSELFREQRNIAKEYGEEWIRINNELEDENRKFTRRELSDLMTSENVVSEQKRDAQLRADGIELVREILMNLKEEK